jgi:hypothetical protein
MTSWPDLSADDRLPESGEPVEIASGVKHIPAGRGHTGGTSVAIGAHGETFEGWRYLEREAERDRQLPSTPGDRAVWWGTRRERKRIAWALASRMWRQPRAVAGACRAGRHRRAPGSAPTRSRGSRRASNASRDGPSDLADDPPLHLAAPYPSRFGRVNAALRRFLKERGLG